MLQKTIHTLSLKRGFFVGIYKKKGLGLFEGITERKNEGMCTVYIIVVIIFNCHVNRYTTKKNKRPPL